MISPLCVQFCHPRRFRSLSQPLDNLRTTLRPSVHSYPPPLISPCLVPPSSHTSVLSSPLDHHSSSPHDLLLFSSLCDLSAFLFILSPTVRLTPSLTFRPGLPLLFGPFPSFPVSHLLLLQSSLSPFALRRPPLLRHLGRCVLSGCWLFTAPLLCVYSIDCLPVCLVRRPGHTSAQSHLHTHTQIHNYTHKHTHPRNRPSTCNLCLSSPDVLS